MESSCPILYVMLCQIVQYNVTAYEQYVHNEVNTHCLDSLLYTNTNTHVHAHMIADHLWLHPIGTDTGI